MDTTTNKLTYNEFKGKMNVWSEQTTTSPSGCHLGHYKALFSTIDRSLEPKKRSKLQDFQKDIASCYIGIVNYCIKHRYVLERLKKQ